MDVISVLLLLVIFPFFLVGYNFVCFLIKGKIHTKKSVFLVMEIMTILILPIFFLSSEDYGLKNDCCSNTATFSAENSIGIYTLIIFGMIAYGFSSYRKQLFPPILELLVNVILVLGLVLNIILCVHLTTAEDGYLYWIFGNIPIIMLFLIQLYKNHLLLGKHIQDNISVTGLFGKLSLSILTLKPILKYPVLLFLLLPIVVILSSFLVLVGQKPDSLISAFTDTYKHGFSQLDYMCNNVDCGGHFLCSVGANGHKNIVKPIRLGERNGGTIICNRQLLISNAFEDLIQEKTPKLHKFIRSKYNKVGDVVHKYYGVFAIKWVSDIIYILMKPLEWLFLATLYALDTKPENRIAVQYLKKEDRLLINDTITQCL